jgi:hypothetical protein
MSKGQRLSRRSDKRLEQVLVDIQTDYYKQRWLGLYTTES